MERLWKVRDVAELLNVSESWTYSACEKGILPHLRLNGCLRFQPSQIKQFLQEAAMLPDQMQEEWPE